MPPFQSRSTGARSRAWISSLGRQRLRLDAERRPRLGGERDRLRRAREDAAAGRDQRRVVVGPGRARQREEPLPLGEARRRVRIRVEEDVTVVERADQPDVAGEQHAVAEDVAGHVANSDDGEVGGLDVGPELAEVALDRLPGAAGGDRHLLVVVAGRAARRRTRRRARSRTRSRSRSRCPRRSPCPCRRRRRGTGRPRRGGRRRAAARPCRRRSCRSRRAGRA